ncbi:MAG TPA: molybdopterin-dependent oxidoreductase [Myxococcota bacterium]|nr:molybdopterin-dependent oxidoreductase [Myxococcota bacterium]
MTPTSHSSLHRAADPDGTTRDIVRRTCTLCEATCGIRVTVSRAAGTGDRVERIEGDPEDLFSRGHVCPKAHALGDLQDDPDRLRGPLRRTATGFEPIGWEEALDLAAERLTAIRDAHGVDAIALYRGNPTIHDAQSLLYWNVVQRAIPTRSQFSAGSLDTWPRWVQAGLMYGGFLNTPVPDVDRCDHLFVVGANPVASNGSLMTAPGIKKRLEALRARGGRLVVVDPRRTETAAIADEHVPIRPGGDAAMLLAMVHVLFAESLVDLGAAAGFVRDLPRVREVVASLPPERVALACGVEAETIRRLARELARAPRAAVYGRMGASVQRFGTLTHWAIDLLAILTGRLDREGGLLFPRPAASLAFAGGRPGEAPAFGREKSPVSGYDQILGEWPMAAFSEEIESEREDRIRALVVIAGNPVCSTPHAARVARALDRLEFMVAFDYYLNETTRHADLILPPTPPLSNDTYDLALLHFAVENVAKWSPAAMGVEPGLRPIWRTLLGLAKRVMGLHALSDEQVDDLVVGQIVPLVLERSPFAGKLDATQIVEGLAKEPGPRRLIDLLLRLGAHGDGFGLVPDGLSLERLAECPQGVSLGRLEPSLPECLETPSGAIELAPERILADLPHLAEWLDGASSVGVDRPFLLIGRREIRSMNSWLHNLPSLMKGRDRCTLEIASADAARLGIATGDPVRITGRVGEVVAPAEVSDRVRPGVVCLPHGWGHDLPGTMLSVASKRPGVNANLVIDDAGVDRPSGTSILTGVPVSITRA